MRSIGPAATCRRRTIRHGGDRQLESSMTISRPEALASARKLCRTLMSAPLPQVSAQTIFAELVRAKGWDPAHQDLITGFGEWLASRPPPSALKARCEALLAAIGYASRALYVSTLAMPLSAPATSARVMLEFGPTIT